jgi:hypothetical protein
MSEIYVPIANWADVLRYQLGADGLPTPGLITFATQSPTDYRNNPKVNSCNSLHTYLDKPLEIHL